MAGNEDRAAGSVRLASAAGRWVLAVAVLGDAMILLEATVVNVALPTIGRDLGASVAELQWTLNGYVLTLAALILVGGSLSDTYGRRRMFILGTMVFVAASALRGRRRSGFSSLPGSFRGLGLSYTPGALRSSRGSSFPIAPGDRRVGGSGCDRGCHWPHRRRGPAPTRCRGAVFLINLPLGVFVVVAAVRHVPETRDPTRAGGPDLRGAALANAGHRRCALCADRGVRGLNRSGYCRLGRRPGRRSCLCRR